MKAKELENEAKDGIFELKKEIAKKEIAKSLKSVESAELHLDYTKTSHSNLLDKDIKDFELLDNHDGYTCCTLTATC